MLFLNFIWTFNPQLSQVAITNQFVISPNQPVVLTTIIFSLKQYLFGVTTKLFGYHYFANFVAVT